MAKIKNYEKFIADIASGNFKPYVKRFQQLAGIIKENNTPKTYLIEITFDFGTLLEHEAIKHFRKSNNRYYFHAASVNPPVKAHYHVIGPNNNKEIYAISTDGTFHHRRNQGYVIPKKEADELRALGVSISSDNIIEHIDSLDSSAQKILTESLRADCISILLEFEIEE